MENADKTNAVSNSELIKALGTQLVEADAYVCITCKVDNVQIHASGGHLLMLGAIELAKQQFLQQQIKMAEAFVRT